MVLLTGITGLAGSHIARQLLADGFTVRALIRPTSKLDLIRDIADRVQFTEGDISDVFITEEAVKDVNTVIHAAGIVSFSKKDEEEMYRVNVQSTADLVNVCRRAGVQKFCYISSVSALGGYGETAHKIITEKDFQMPAKKAPAYAKSKYLGEKEVWRAREEGLDAVILNPSVILGAGNPEKSSTRLFKHIKDKKKYYPEGAFNYNDAKDLARAVSLIIKSDVSGERFIINAGSITYNHFFETAAKFVGQKPPHIRITPRTAGWAARFDALRSALTGSPRQLTAQTVRLLTRITDYDNSKFKNRFQFDYTPSKETIHRICKTLFND